MIGLKRREAQAADEAAAWHARLGAKSVTTQTIEEFFAWRRDPLNDAAYRKVEAMWERARDLQGSPVIAKAMDEALGRRRERRALQPVLVGAGALAAVLVLAVGTANWLQARSQFATAVGEERRLQLADGSAVQLDTASSVRIRFSGGERRVVLEAGRALFTVAHEADRPFIVESGEAEVRAVGTVFDVRRSGDAVVVSMVEGVVEVSQGAVRGRSPERIGAGEQLRIGAGAQSTRQIDPATATSWVRNRLIFRDAPLHEAVAEVNRYLVAKIELAPDAPQTSPVSGVFHTGDREAFVAAAAMLLNLDVDRRSDGSVRLGADKNISEGSAENAT
jgi:transmembrane sensor